MTPSTGRREAAALALAPSVPPPAPAAESLAAAPDDRPPLSAASPSPPASAAPPSAPSAPSAPSPAGGLGGATGSGGTARTLSFPRGALIFREGESGAFAYIVEAGRVEIVKGSATGDVVLAEVTPGGLFGEMAVIDSSPRSASARAADEVRVRELNRDAFLRHIQARPDLALGMMSRLAGYVRSANLSAAMTLGNGSGGDAAEVLIRDAVLPPLRPTDQVVEDTDALYEAPPRRALMLGTAAVMGFVVTTVLFLSLSFVDKTVQGRGKLMTQVPNVIVQASDNATIQSLEVERGQSVKVGQVIARLDGTFVRSNLAVVNEKLAAVNQRLERIRLEQAVMTGVDPRDLAPRMARLDAVNRDILAKRSDEFRSRMNSFAAQLSNREAEQIAARETAEIAAEQLELKTRIEDARQSLYQSGAGSLLNYLSSRDDRLDAHRRWRDAVNALSTLHTSHAATVAEREAFVAHWSSTLAELLARDEETRIELVEEKVRLERQTSDLAVRAPVAGVVLELPRVQAGSIVQAGQALVTLVPTDSPLAVEVDVDPRDVSDLRLGGPVSVKLDALPFQQYGDLPGRLGFVSDDTHAESLFGAKGAFYRARVELLPEAEERLPPGFHLTPGLLVTADLKVGKRRLITYFTNPVIRNVATAFREPD